MATTIQHVRKCHICSGINIQERTPIQRCNHCGKALTPFCYGNYSSFELVAESNRPNIPPGEYSPLVGLSAIWNDDPLGDKIGRGRSKTYSRG